VGSQRVSFARAFRPSVLAGDGWITPSFELEITR
jgi:hypothetical protein